MRMVLTALVWLFILIMVVGFGGALIMVGYAHDRKGLLRPDDLDPADGLAHAADHDPGLILDLLPFAFHQIDVARAHAFDASTARTTVFGYDTQ